MQDEARFSRVLACFAHLQDALMFDCERSHSPALPALSQVLLALFEPPQDATDAAGLAAVQQASLWKIDN